MGDAFEQVLYQQLFEFKQSLRQLYIGLHQDKLNCSVILGPKSKQPTYFLDPPIWQEGLQWNNDDRWWLTSWLSLGIQQRGTDVHYSGACFIELT